MSSVFFTKAIEIMMQIPAPQARHGIPSQMPEALFTSQVFLGLEVEIPGPRANPESSPTARLLLRYF
jgi:hypothetical protein